MLLGTGNRWIRFENFNRRVLSIGSDLPEFEEVWGNRRIVRAHLGPENDSARAPWQYMMHGADVMRERTRPFLQEMEPGGVRLPTDVRAFSEYYGAGLDVA